MIRSLQAADLSEVLRIEQQAMADPWSEGQLIAEINAANGVGFVAEQGDQVSGYAFFRTCTPECELLHLVVAPQWRRQGVGNTLLDQAMRCFSGQGFATCFLEVRCSNEAARRLYLKAGFFQVGIRKKYYRQPVEDALQLCRNLTDIKGENL